MVVCNKQQFIYINNIDSFFFVGLSPRFSIILLICSVKVSITDLHRNLPCSNPDTVRQSGNEVRLVVSNFITLIKRGSRGAARAAKSLRWSV